ncbi:MAG: hypothetical protein GC155_08730 [Alphaproteobacteria bacterium]|nr:hypothetical protein [Alphaproteobacteria bacterium]
MYGRELPYIRVHYQGEKRLTPAGREVEWLLIMVDRDTFYWHRTDWPATGTTAPVKRCPDRDLVG